MYIHMRVSSAVEAFCSCNHFGSVYGGKYVMCVSRCCVHTKKKRAPVCLECTKFSLICSSWKNIVLRLWNCKTFHIRLSPLHSVRILSFTVHIPYSRRWNEPFKRKENVKESKCLSGEKLWCRAYISHRRCHLQVSLNIGYSISIAVHPSLAHFHFNGLFAYSLARWPEPFTPFLDLCWCCAMQRVFASLPISAL